MLKVLQLLGNSVRGLDQARWRLAYNAICLPVLTYGCQLWYTGKQVTLVKKLQTVQNEAVQLISGMFQTTPCEPLHQLLNILPIDLHLNMLLQKTAFRLYKAPKGSQLLIRLGGDWHSPSTNDLPLLAPNRASLKTTLCTLAARVPVNGPWVDPFPNLPPGAPGWNGQVKVIPKQKEWDYEHVTNSLIAKCRKGSTINIFCDGLISNNGCPDGKQIGTTAAVLYQEGKEAHHLKRVLGKSVTEQDTMICALHSGMDLLISFLDSQPTQQHKLINFALASETALKKALDTSPHGDQAESIKILERLGRLLDKYPINIMLLWMPRKTQFIGFRRVKQLALEAARTADLTTISEPQMINSQLKQAKTAAIEAWAN